MTGATVINAQTIVGYTPPGVAGSADVVARTAGVDRQAQQGFSCLTAADPVAGGFGGGPVAGDVTVRVIDQRSGHGRAYVVLGDPGRGVGLEKTRNLNRFALSKRCSGYGTAGLWGVPALRRAVSGVAGVSEL